MPDPINPPPVAQELLKVMFGQAASLVVSASPRLDRWAAAFADWLESISSAGGRAARLQALNSWEQLLRFHSCPPWELNRSILEAWTTHLAESGLSASTIRCYQGRISAFFRFCSRRLELLSTEFQLFGSSAKPSNPLRAVPRPKNENYRSAYILCPAEARLLLRVVDRQSSLVGKRDYAILLTLLLTGLTEDELRHLRWSQVDAGLPVVRLVFGSGSPAKELPSPAWDAILAYLKASGRFPVMQPDDFIFVPLSDPLLCPPSGLPEDWCRDRPLSTEQMLVFLKAYAASVGLDASRVTYACLRHTSAALHLESGADAAGLQRFLGRQYLKETRRYLPPRGRYQRKEPHAQPGNQNALKHGFFSQNPPQADPRDALSANITGLDGEIAALRLRLRRALALAGSPDNLPDALRLLDLYGISAGRLSRMLLRVSQMQAQDAEAALESGFSENAAEPETPDSPDTPRPHTLHGSRRR